MKDGRWPASPPRDRLWVALLMCLVLISGSLLGLLRIWDADLRMRESLLGKVHLLAETVNLEYVKQLTGSEADLQSPVYRRLKEQFSAILPAFPRGASISLLGKRPDGSVFFFLNAAPPDAEGEFPLPGKTYEEVDPALLSVFSDRTPVIYGPFRGPCGLCMACWFPLAEPKTGDLVAVLAAGFRGETWSIDAARTGLAPFLAALSLCAIFLYGHIQFRRRQRMGENARWWPSHLEAFLVGAAGIALSLSAAWIAGENERHGNEQQFHNLSRAETSELRNSLKDLRDINLEGLGLFFENSEYVDLKEFSSYTRRLARIPEIRMVTWNPLVPANARPSFEEAMRKNGMENFRIWELDWMGSPVSAAERPVYYPQLYVSRHGDVFPDSGFDAGTDPISRAAMEEAASTGMVSASEPVWEGTPGRNPEIRIFRPVSPRGISGSILGFAGVVLDLEAWLKGSSAAGGGDTGGTQVLLDLWQLRPDAPPRFLTARFPITGDSQGERDFTKEGDGMTMTSPIFAFGRTYVLRSRPGPGFIRTSHPVGGEATLLWGLLLSGAAALLTGTLSNRRKKLESIVRNRTLALGESEFRFRTLAEEAPFPVLVCDPWGVVLFANPGARKLFALPHPLTEGLRIFGPDSGYVDHDAYRVFTEEIRASGRVEGREMLFRNGENEHFWGLVSARKILFDGMEGMILALQDITRRKEVEENLRMAKQIIRSSSEGIMITNPQGEIEDVNAAFESLTGYSLGDIKGLKPSVLAAQKGVEKAFPEFWEILGKGGVWQGETWNRRKDGEAYPVWLTVSSVVNDHGEVTHFAGFLTDIGDIKNEQLRLSHLAHHDSLTGLPNRLLFLDRLEMAVARAKREARQMAVVFLDLDGFKKINDTMGHQTGDLLLSEVGSRLSAAIREDDTVARLGGDEFALIFEGLVNPEDAKHLAGRIKEVFREPFTVGGYTLSVDVSIGVALCPENGAEGRDLLAAADRAMYTAKNGSSKGEKSS